MRRRTPPPPHAYLDSMTEPGYCARPTPTGVCRRPEAHGLHRDPNTDLLPERTDAEALREAGMRQAIEAPANQADRDAVRAAIITAAQGRESLDANDVRPLLPPSVNTAVIGSVFNAMRREGLLTFEGYVKSTDPGTHSKHINQWGVTPTLRALTERTTAA